MWVLIPRDPFGIIWGHVETQSSDRQPETPYERFQKTHDIYSLEPILLELGLLSGLGLDPKFKKGDDLNKTFAAEAFSLPSVLNLGANIQGSHVGTSKRATC